MDNERQNELKNSTFVEKGEVSVEAVSEGPKVFVENEVAKNEKSVDVKKNTSNVGQKSDPIVEKGLGYGIDENEEEFSEVSDYSSANMWRKALKDKKTA